MLKLDLVSNNQQWLRCHKTQPNYIPQCQVPGNYCTILLLCRVHIQFDSKSRILEWYSLLLLNVTFENVISEAAKVEKYFYHFSMF